MTKGERLTVSFTQREAPACAPLAATSTHSSQPCGGLKDWIPLCTFLVLLIFPAYSMSQWIFETEICPSPCPQTSPALRSPAHLLTTMTTARRSRLDKRSEGKPDCAGRERKVNMVTVSSSTPPLTLQSFCQPEG